MFAGFEEQLRRYAEVIVRFGLNLRAGQRVLLAEPYELQGVARAAAPLVDVIATAVTRAGGGEIETLWGDEAAWRAAAGGEGVRGFVSLLARATERVQAAIARGDALVFLVGVNPQLADGVPPVGAARVRRLGGEAYARYAPELLAGATNWTAAAAPTPAWADVVFPDLPRVERLARLWEAVLAAGRADRADPLAAWAARAAELARRRDELNARRPRRVRFHGPGTDLTLEVPAAHRWCTALLTTRDGRPFAPNLPTEEVFTAPHAASAEGRLQVARPLFHAGAIIDGVELEFRGGDVVRARARIGAELLERVLAADRGACRLGEVALIEGATPVGRTGRCFRHALLDENALPHVALGDAYAFTAPQSTVRNRSVLHLDLPLEAEVLLS
ncbi:MAG: aminopeptidase [Opitutaceae bacterium]